MSAFVPAFALIGFTLALFTNTLGAPATIGLLLIWIMSIDTKTSVSLAFGSALGLVYAWAFRLAPLLRWGVWRSGWLFLPRDAPGAIADDPVGSARVFVFVFDARPTFYLLSGVVAWAGAFFLFNKILPILNCILLLLVAIGALFYILLTWYTSENPSRWLTAGFSLAASGILLTPLLYAIDFETHFVKQALFQAGLLLVVVAIGALHLRWLTLAASPSRQALASDMRGAPSQTSAWRVALRWGLLWFVLAVIYLVAGIADEWSEGSLDTVVQAVFVTTLALGVLALVVGWFIWWHNDAYAYYTITSTNDATHFTAATTPSAFDEESPEERAATSLSNAAPHQYAPRATKRTPTHPLAKYVTNTAPSRLSALELKRNQR